MNRLEDIDFADDLRLISQKLNDIKKLEDYKRKAPAADGEQLSNRASGPIPIPEEYSI